MLKRIFETAQGRIPVFGSPDCDLAILIGPQGEIRMLDAAGWALSGLLAEHGAKTAYRVTRERGQVWLEGRSGGDTLPAAQRIPGCGRPPPAGIPRRRFAGARAGVPTATPGAASSEGSWMGTRPCYPMVVEASKQRFYAIGLDPREIAWMRLLLPLLRHPDPVVGVESRTGRSTQSRYLEGVAAARADENRAATAIYAGGQQQEFIRGQLAKNDSASRDSRSRDPPFNGRHAARRRSSSFSSRRGTPALRFPPLVPRWAATCCSHSRFCSAKARDSASRRFR